MSVSVIVPIYNIERQLLLRGIESLLHQSLAPQEVILIDDGSNEETAKLCDDLAVESMIIKVIHQDNKGVSSARNLGVQVTSADWIMFFDPDDYLETNALEKLVEHIDQSVDIICCCCCVETDGQLVRNSFFLKPYAEWSDNDLKKELILQLLGNANKEGGAYTAIGVPWGKLYRTSFIREHNLEFNTQLYRMQDNIFNMWAFYLARKVIYVDMPLYRYNYSNIATFKYKYDPRLIGLYEALWEERTRFINEHYRDDNQLIQALYRLIVENVYTVCRRTIFNPGNTTSFFRQIEGLRVLLSNDYVDKAVTNYRDYSTKKDRIKTCLLKGKKYLLVGLYIKIEYMITKIKNQEK